MARGLATTTPSALTTIQREAHVILRRSGIHWMVPPTSPPKSKANPLLSSAVPQSNPRMDKLNALPSPHIQARGIRRRRSGHWMIPTATPMAVNRMKKKSTCSTRLSSSGASRIALTAAPSTPPKMAALPALPSTHRDQKRHSNGGTTGSIVMGRRRSHTSATPGRALKAAPNVVPLRASCPICNEASLPTRAAIQATAQATTAASTHRPECDRRWRTTPTTTSAPNVPPSAPVAIPPRAAPTSRATRKDMVQPIAPTRIHHPSLATCRRSTNHCANPTTAPNCSPLRPAVGTP